MPSSSSNEFSAPDLEAPCRPGRRQRGLMVAVVGFVYAIAHMAEMLSVDADHLHDLFLGLKPEDGRLCIYDTDDQQAPAFMRRSVMCSGRPASCSAHS